MSSPLNACTMAILKFKIDGMHCNACKMLIEDTSLEIAGVLSCSVDVERGIATIEHDGTVDPLTLKTTIGGLGNYEVTVV